MQKPMRPNTVYGVYMTRMVQLSEDAYNRLKMAKLPKESFSQAVLRILRPKSDRPLSGLVGLLSPKEVEALVDSNRRIDELDRKRDERIRRHWQG